MSNVEYRRIETVLISVYPCLKKKIVFEDCQGPSGLAMTRKRWGRAATLPIGVERHVKGIRIRLGIV